MLDSIGEPPILQLESGVITVFGSGGAMPVFADDPVWDGHP